MALFYCNKVARGSILKLHPEHTVVLTGGAGFIGSCVLRELNNRGIYQIVIVDDLDKSESWKNLRGKRFSEILHKSQLTDWLQGRESEIGSIIHLGACSSTTETDANYLIENNYRYTRRLIELSLKHDIRFVYASSAATYGSGSEGFSDDHSLLESLKPLNMYGYSKHLVDLWAYREGILSSICGLKYFNVFGPNEYHKGRMSSALTRMVPDALKSGSIKLFASTEPNLFADGEQKRDFIYVKDAAAITCDLLVSERNGIYNVGSGVASTWKELARSVFKALRIPEKIEYIETPSDLLGKYQNLTRADIHKLEIALGRKACAYSLENAVIEYVQKYLILDEYW